jgi:hypothetical protein
MSGMSSWSHFGTASGTGTGIRMTSQSPLRRTSLADRTAYQYHGGNDDDGKEADSTSDSSTTTTSKAVNPHEMDLSHVSDDTFTTSSDTNKTSSLNTDDDTSSSDDADDISSDTHNTTSSDTNVTAADLDKAAAKASNADYYSAKRKKMHTTKGLNGTEPTLSQWDSPNTTFDPTNMTSNSTVTIPSEQTQPDSWPFIVFLVFALLAAGLCSATAIKSCKNRKRKNYDEIESLIV